MKKPHSLVPTLLLLAALPITGCGDRQATTAEIAHAPTTAAEAPEAPEAAETATAAKLSPSSGLDTAVFTELAGEVIIDGSSTVFPITEAVANVFEKLAPASRVSLGVSGTGGGFKKFCRGETDISDASRPIKASEDQLCAQNGVRYIEVPVAFDGISVVVHADNDWSACMTVQELRSLWRPQAEAAVTTWQHVRQGWPEKQITLYAPGHDSGTFDYFTEAIVGEEGSARADFIGSEDDYLLAQDIAGDGSALGFFGFAYYHEYRQRLNLVAIDAGAGCVEPGEAPIADGSYRPLSRPIFIYLSTDALARADVSSFVALYLDLAPAAVPSVGYVPLPPRAYELNRERVERRTTGSLFADGSQVGISIERLLELEGGADS